jgi:hypothetical protein
VSRAGIVVLLVLAALVAPAGARVQRTERRQPCADRDPLRRAFFGDLHVHTSFSLDAATQGTRNTPRDAYRFARGELLGIQPYDREGNARRTLRLERALDFAAVTDHAEMFGEVLMCETPGFPGHSSPICLIYRWWPRLAFYVMNSRSAASYEPQRYSFCGENDVHCLGAGHTVWTEVQEAAEAAYDRTDACTFTTFVGYEWTGAPEAKNLHRNVIFRNAQVPPMPVTYYEAPTEERLWDALDDACGDLSGCEVLAIPHNSNLSGGMMFEPINSGEYAVKRARFEPLVEVMQHKGSSECRPGVETEDELCAFESLPYDSFGAKFVTGLVEEPTPGDFVRNALRAGLLQQATLGVNSLKVGLVASTDTHLGTPGAVEPRAHPGHGGAGAPAPASLPTGFTDDVEFNPGGLAVLWAEENSRDALFQAMLRRETYGTSGPRMVVRFFGGWGYDPTMCGDPGFAARGYRQGVPMGADLPSRPAGASPRFAVWAMQDAGTERIPGAPLQRVQIVKGWAIDGQTHEKVYDVAGDASMGGGTDPDTCELDGSGARELCAVWTDPEFDPHAHAFYYARVLEVPTCRWHAFACNAHRIDCAKADKVPAGFDACCDPGRSKLAQQRAWTSPIWYGPGR